MLSKKVPANTLDRHMHMLGLFEEAISLDFPEQEASYFVKAFYSYCDVVLQRQDGFPKQEWECGTLVYEYVFRQMYEDDTRDAAFEWFSALVRDARLYIPNQLSLAAVVQDVLTDGVDMSIEKDRVFAATLFRLLQHPDTQWVIGRAYEGEEERLRKDVLACNAVIQSRLRNK